MFVILCRDLFLSKKYVRRTSIKIFPKNVLPIPFNWPWNGYAENSLIVNKVQGFGEFKEKG